MGRTALALAGVAWLGPFAPTAVSLKRLFESRALIVPGPNEVKRVKNVDDYVMSGIEGRGNAEVPAPLDDSDEGWAYRCIKQPWNPLCNIENPEQMQASRDEWAQAIQEIGLRDGLYHWLEHDDPHFFHMCPTGRTGTFFQRLVVAKVTAIHHGLRYAGAVDFLTDAWRTAEFELIRMLGLAFPIRVEKTDTNPYWFMDESSYFARAIPPSVDPLLNRPRIRNRLREEMNITMPKGYAWNPKADLRVAVHIRRGDLATRKDYSRVSPNSYYLEVMNLIREVARNSEFLIISSKDFGGDLGTGYESWQFEYQRNCKFMLGYPLKVTWPHMIEADILIMSKSSLSYTPAIFARGMVIYEYFWYPPLPDWIVTNGTHQSVTTPRVNDEIRARARLAYMERKAQLEKQAS